MKRWQIPLFQPAPWRPAGSAAGLVGTLAIGVGALVSSLPALATDMHGPSRARTHLTQSQVVRQADPGRQGAPRQTASSRHQDHGDSRQPSDRDHGSVRPGTIGGRHDDRDRNPHGHVGRDDHGHQWGPRGRPTSVRPHVHHHPPPPVVVVPPCKRGGPGITPC